MNETPPTIKAAAIGVCASAAAAVNPAVWGQSREGSCYSPWNGLGELIASPVQVTCGTELATVLIQACRDDRLAADKTAVDRVLAILDAFEPCSYSPAEYGEVARAALKWLNPPSDEDPPEAVDEVHARLGKYLFKDQDLDRLATASAHLARGGDMPGLAHILSQASQVTHWLAPSF